MHNPPGTFVYALEIPVRWSDMDDFGHVNNSVYLTYFEQARISWWMSTSPPNIDFATTGPVIINASCTFYKAIVYPETVIVKLYVSPPRRSSYDCFYQIFSQSQPELLYADGATKVVWVDRAAERSIPLPDYMRRLLPES
jgi:acyl-CoA thioester hydrolase